MSVLQLTNFLDPLRHPCPQPSVFKLHNPAFAINCLAVDEPSVDNRLSRKKVIVVNIIRIVEHQHFLRPPSKFVGYFQKLRELVALASTHNFALERCHSGDTFEHRSELCLIR